MSKNNKWHKVIIFLALALTAYNILPTLIYYAKPLNKQVNERGGEAIFKEITHRVNVLEKDSVSWLISFNKLIGVHSTSIVIDKQNPQLIKLVFNSQESANKFKQHLPRAGNFIPFFPSKLSLSPLQIEKTTPTSGETIDNEYIVYVQRKIPVSLTPTKSYFNYSKKFHNEHTLTTEYKNLIQDRLEQLIYSICSTSENAELAELSLSESNQSQAFLLTLCQNLVKIDTALNDEPLLKTKFFKTLTMGYFDKPQELVKNLVRKIQSVAQTFNQQASALTAKKNTLNNEQLNHLNSVTEMQQVLKQCQNLLLTQEQSFISHSNPIERNTIHTLLEKSFSTKKGRDFSFDTEEYNPIIQSIHLDTKTMELRLKINESIINLQSDLLKSNKKANEQILNQLIFSEIAKIKRESNENFKKSFNDYSASLDDLAEASSFITLNLEHIKKEKIKHVKHVFSKQFNPTHQDLKRSSSELLTLDELQTLALEKRAFQFVLLNNGEKTTKNLRGFNESSIYIIAKDLAKGIKTYQSKNTKKAKEFMQNVEQVSTLLKDIGFTGILGSTPPFAAMFANDVIFELSDYYQPLLMASREKFRVSGSKKYAVLALSTNKERLQTLNEIENAIQMDRIKEYDEYNYARTNTHSRTFFDAPKPTKGLIWMNFLLSVKKYFRGDQDRVLKWGLDLSGGKSVHVILKNNNNKVITDESDLKQGINELYQRVNKLGVSDVTIRQEGSTIAIDFPSDSTLSANELVKASTMTLHIVNEKFGMQNQHLAEDTHAFLQEVYNEALVTNQLDIDSINTIAYSHLYGQNLSTDNPQPKSSAAKALYKAGLRIANPLNSTASSNMNTTLCKIAAYPIDNKELWHVKTHPLVVCMNNWALEGANLENVQANYDATKGNFLSFSVKNTYKSRDGTTINPQDNLFKWTSVFSTSRIGGTPYEQYSNARGWRLAVILNGRIISEPILEDALREHGSISGSFTSRQVQKLASDLKAGSLTFKPSITSEQSVSPDLGFKERFDGIKATILALIAVLITMIAYYRFAGFIASIALILNLLIIWATLQNLQASVTLAGLSGVILTLGMAVDANVLVFERVREEYEKSKQMLQALSSGYKKAFTAIFDSNITTVIAAFILLQFDSGPIKGFALTLIIGIISSMFTALFLTRYILNSWARKNKNKSLKMSKLVNLKSVNFLKYSKIAWTSFALICTFGFLSVVSEGKNLLGIDFTGGFSTTFEVIANKNNPTSNKDLISKALLDNKIKAQDFQIKQMGHENKIKLFLGKNLTEQNGILSKLAPSIEPQMQKYSYEDNPILIWIVDVLKKNDINLTKKSLLSLDSNFSTISGQMSDTMRSQALVGLLFALISILIYITFRFEFKFALCATLGLAFDLLATLALLCILHFVGVSVQIDLNVIAAFMTIIGYSLNDTIIVFDRIRENMKSLRKNSFISIINLSINETFSRTILTSFTTLIVLISLLVFGGNSILGFSLIMAIGVVIGTLSTLFIATSLLSLSFRDINPTVTKKKLVLKNGNT